MGNAIITFLMSFDLAPCDKKSCSEHQTLFHAFWEGLGTRLIQDSPSNQCLQALVYTEQNLKWKVMRILHMYGLTEWHGIADRHIYIPRLHSVWGSVRFNVSLSSQTREGDGLA